MEISSEPSLEDMNMIDNHTISSEIDISTFNNENLLNNHPSIMKKLQLIQQSPENMKLVKKTILNEAIRQIKLHQNYKNIIRICLEDMNELCLDCLCELAKLFDNEIMKMSFIYSGALSDLIILLSNQNQEIQEEMANILHVLSSEKECVDTLLNSSLSMMTPLLIDVLTSGTVLAKEYAMSTLMELLRYDDNEIIIIENDYFQKLVTSLQNESQDEMKCREFISSIFVTISTRHMYESYFYSSNFLSFCLTTLERQKENTYHFVVNILHILFNLSLLDEKKTLLGESRLIPILLNLLKLGKQDELSNFFLNKHLILEMSAGILLSLSSKVVNKRRILENISILKLFLEYLEITYPLPIRTNMIGILVNLSMNENVQKYIVSHSGLMVYINSLKTFSSYYTNALLSLPITSVFSSIPTSQTAVDERNSEISSHPNYQLLTQYLIRILTALIRLLPLRYHRDVMIHLGLVPKLCSILHSPFRDQGKYLVTALMLALTEDKENLYTFTANDYHGVISLFTIFKDTKPISEGIAILENTTGCLLNIIASDNLVRQYLLDQGIVPFLIRLLPIIPSSSIAIDESFIKSSEIRPIRSALLNSESNQLTPVCPNMQQTLITSTFDERGGGYMTLAENSAEILRLLILSPEIRQEIINLGALPLLLRLIDHGSTLAKESCIGIILSIVYHEEHIAQVMQLPFLPSLVRLAANSKGYPRIKELIVETIYYLAQDEDIRVYLGREGAITPVVMMLKYGTSLPMKHLSLETLLLLAEEYENKHLIGEINGLITLLINYMRGIVEDNSTLESPDAKSQNTAILLEMKEMSTLLLRLLAEDPDCRNVMRKSHLTPQSILYQGIW